MDRSSTFSLHLDLLTEPETALRHSTSSKKSSKVIPFSLDLVDKTSYNSSEIIILGINRF